MPKIIITILLLLVLAVSVSAQYRLQVTAMESSGLPGDSGVLLPIHVVNSQDIIAGFQLWFQISNPDLGRFSLEVDTTGCLVSGWQLISTNSLSGQNTDLLVTGLANSIVDPYVPGFNPQNGLIPLIKIKLDLFDVPDTLSIRSGNILINTYMLSRFSFTNPGGGVIGLSQHIVYDTTYYRCLAYNGLDCTQWVQVISPPYDSIYVNAHEEAYLDTSIVSVNNGKIHIALCGNVDAFDNVFDISDLLYLVDYMFKDPAGPAPVNMDAADVNNSGQFDINDLLYLVDYMFKDPPGPKPTCK